VGQWTAAGRSLARHPYDEALEAGQVAEPE